MSWLLVSGWICSTVWLVHAHGQPQTHGVQLDSSWQRWCSDSSCNTTFSFFYLYPIGMIRTGSWAGVDVHVDGEVATSILGCSRHTPYQPHKPWAVLTPNGFMAHVWCVDMGLGTIISSDKVTTYQPKWERLPDMHTHPFKEASPVCDRDMKTATILYVHVYAQ